MDIYTLLQDPIVSTILGAVSAGLLAFMINVLKNAISRLNTEKVNYARVDSSVKIAYLSARMHKNALMNSSLSADAKMQAQIDFQAIENMYNSYVAEYIEQSPVSAAPAPQEVITQTLNAMVAPLAAVGMSQIEQLRQQVNGEKTV